MKFHNRTPIYQQIMEYMDSHIINGTWKCGQRIPSVREMSAQIMVNTSTVQRAYQELEETGLIYNERGLGKYVTQSTDTILMYRKTIVQQKVREFLDCMAEFDVGKDELIQTIEKEMAMKGNLHD